MTTNEEPPECDCAGCMETIPALGIGCKKLRWAFKRIKELEEELQIVKALKEAEK